MCRLARRGDRIDRVIDRRKRARGGRHLEQEDCSGEGQKKCERRLPPGDVAAIFADDPGNGEQRKDAERGLEILHCPLRLARARGACEPLSTLPRGTPPD
jgi:hypothetical protein